MDQLNEFDNTNQGIIRVKTVEQINKEIESCKDINNYCAKHVYKFISIDEDSIKIFIINKKSFSENRIRV